jgi:hypothetical protein
MKGRGVIRRVINKRGAVQHVRVKHVKKWTAKREFDVAKKIYYSRASTKEIRRTRGVTVTPVVQAPQPKLVVYHIKLSYDPAKDRAFKEHAKNWRGQQTLWTNAFPKGGKSSSDWSVRIVAERGQEKQLLADVSHYFSEEWTEGYGLLVRNTASVNTENVRESDKKGDVDFELSGARAEAMYYKALKRYVKVD